MGVIYLSIFTCLIISLIYFYKKRSKKLTIKSDSVVEDKVEEVKPFKMVEIKEFDADEYMIDLFKSVFYSIMYDKWTVEVNTENTERVKLSKFLDRSGKDIYGNRNTDKIYINFDYSFQRVEKSKDRIFEIKNVSLNSSSNKYYYPDDLPKDISEHIYSLYSEWMNSNNKILKDETDSSLESILNVIGKSSLRDSKLKDILGDN